ncbi:MAG: 4Fe-4S double cluster binding domain-containing protein [Anaerolineae bacterium]
MGSCRNCSACLRHCPAGAIPSDRFLLRAERCVTFHNESSRDFPDWLHPSWHRCLVGCLRCQEVCPANKEVLHWVVEGGKFSQKETVLLLQGTALDRLPSETARRLEQADLVDLLDVLPRNLYLLLHQGP